MRLTGFPFRLCLLNDAHSRMKATHGKIRWMQYCDLHPGERMHATHRQTGLLVARRDT